MIITQLLVYITYYVIAINNDIKGCINSYNSLILYINIAII